MIEAESGLDYLSDLETLLVGQFMRNGAVWRTMIVATFPSEATNSSTRIR